MSSMFYLFKKKLSKRWGSGRAGVFFTSKNDLLIKKQYHENDCLAFIIYLI